MSRIAASGGSPEARPIIRLIEALNYRCLRYVSQPLGPFHVLVGPNASGKTTFLDVVSFLGDLVADGPEAAVRKRTDNFRDLVWQRQDAALELAIEAVRPHPEPADGEPVHERMLRYEVSLREDPESNTISLVSERLLMDVSADRSSQKKTLFPETLRVPTTIMSDDLLDIEHVVLLTTQENQSALRFEAMHGGVSEGDLMRFRWAHGRPGLGSLPEDETLFPNAIWLKKLLSDGVQSLILDSKLIRKSSPPGRGLRFASDGSNLPWIVRELEAEHPDRFQAWMEHVRTALPDLETVTTKLREEDRHRYLWLRYANGLEIPSWMASDGTVRLLALTLPAYLPDFRGVYLIEEPENGIHPTAVEAVVQSLSSVYNAQILVATHAPAILGSVEPETVLCFAKTPEGATDIVAGDKHPRLRDWRRQENLGVLFAAGVLG